MVYRSNVKHTTMRYGGALKQERHLPANDIIGVISTGHSNTDNSIKLGGGSVLMTNSPRPNHNMVNSKLRSKNKDTLVRTVF